MEAKTKYKIKTILTSSLFSLSFLILLSCQAGTSESNPYEEYGSKLLNENVNDPTDEEITLSVETEFMVQDGVSANDVDTKTNEGIVTLSGTVNNILAKERMIKIAKEIKGVRGVVDKITVDPPEIPDDKLKDNIETAFLYDPAVENGELRVWVNDGNVKLSGVVESWQEKQLAEKVASSVKGVKSVNNQIKYNFSSDRSDYEIKQDIIQTLRWDTRVDDGLIDVEVRDNTAILTGTVGSAAEKSQAEVDAWVVGINDVDVSGLSVERWARDEDLKKDKYISRNDEEVKEAVLDAFLYDPRVFSFNPNVRVDDGKVTLTGVVDNLKAKQAAERDARNVVGVWDVVNQLKVRGDDFPLDYEIEEDIKEAISWNPYLEGNEVGVYVNDGTAYLAGNVDNYYEKYEASEVAATIYGVKAIENNIQVSPDAIPYVYDLDYNYYYPYGYADTYSYTPMRTDLQIYDNINDQIYWSPFVNGEDIDVAVDNGVAILTGTVDTWLEYYRAEKNAFDGGALAVENNLEVEM